MSGLIIGLGLAGAFAAAVSRTSGEMAYDWNGGTVKPGALGRYVKAIAIGAALGAGTGWLFSGDGQTPEQAAISACYDKAPQGATVTITTNAQGVKCEYKP